jgi:hypothetical protein
MLNTAMVIKGLNAQQKMHVGGAEQETGRKWWMCMRWEPFSAGKTMPMDVILRSVNNFYKEFLNNLAPCKWENRQ